MNKHLAQVILQTWDKTLPAIVTFTSSVFTLLQDSVYTQKRSFIHMQ